MDYSRDFLNGGQNILVEHYEDDFEPTYEEVLEYCNMLGLNPGTEKDLMYIAREGIRAPLPRTWKPVEDPAGNIYYFNFETGQSMWEHPCDEFYKNLLKKERQKRSAGDKSTNKKRPNAAKKSSNKKGTGTKKELGSANSSPALGKRHISRDLSGKPPLGTLAPLSSLGGHGSLTGMGNLPKLKKVPQSLAPLQMSGKSGSSAIDDPFRKPFGQSGFKSGPGLAPLTSGKGSLGSLGQVDLGALNISNQYEEEEDSNSEDKSGENFDGKLQSMFGVNLLDSKDFSLKDSDGEDVSKELRKIMNESGTSNTSEELEALHRPCGPILGVDSIHPAQNGLHSLNKPSVTEVSQVTDILRPVTHGQKREVSEGAMNPNVLQQNRPPATNKLLPLSSGNMKSSLQPFKETVAKRPSNALGSMEAMHQADLAEMESAHKKRKDDLRLEMEEAVVALEDKLMQEKEVKMAEIRRKVASEQITEEKELKEKKEAYLCKIQAQLEEEQEDEEARLMEEKEDNVRKLKTKISAEFEKEKKEIETSSQEDHRKRLQEQLKDEEEKCQFSVEEELKQLKKRLDQEKEKEMKSLELAHTEELELLKKKMTEEHVRMKKELQAKCHEEIEYIKAKAEEEQQIKIEEVQNELKKTFDIEETKTKMLQSFKGEETELKEEFAVKLERERSELSIQHEAEMETLRLDLKQQLRSINEEAELEMKASKETLEKELNDTKTALEEEHKTKLLELKEEYKRAEVQLEKEKLDQVNTLEAIQSEYDVKKAEIVQKLAELAQQAEGIEERKKRLQAEEKEAGLEEARLVQLRSANAMETEALLQKQDSELKIYIEKEEKHLKKLKKARSELESEILKLNDKKSAAEKRVIELEQQELAYIKKLEKLQEDFLKFRESKLVTPLVSGSSDNESQPASVQEVKGVKPFGSNEQKPSEQAAALQESWMVADDDLDSVTMSLQELEPPGANAPVKTMTGLEELELMKIRMKQWHKGIKKELEEERKSLSKRKDYFQKKERSLKKRQGDYQLASMGQKSHKRKQALVSPYVVQKQLCNEDNVALMAEIQSKLDQEAAALAVLEKKVKASNRLLDSKEEGVNKLEACAGRQHGSHQCHDKADPPVQLSTDMEEKLHRLHSVLSSTKNSRRASNFSTYPQTYQASTHSGIDLSSTSSSDESDIVKELQRNKHHHHNHRSSVSPVRSTPSPQQTRPHYPHSARLSPFQSTTPSKKDHTWNPQLYSTQRVESGSTPLPMSQNSRQASSNSVMETLMSINSQVAELMSRVGSSSDNGPAHLSNPGNSRPLPQDRYRSPLHKQESLVYTPASARWADTTATSQFRDEKRNEDRKLQDSESVLESPAIFPTSTTSSRVSTEALLKKQTDWLKEFTQHTSQLKPRASSSLKTSSTSLPNTAEGSAAPSAETTTLDHLKFAGRPKLILDSRDKIQLIHV